MTVAAHSSIVTTSVEYAVTVTGGRSASTVEDTAIELVVLLSVVVLAVDTPARRVF